MKWILLRKSYTEKGIFGELTSEDGNHFLFTLEHAYKICDEISPGSVEYYPKIPTGLHRCVSYNSPKHNMIVPLLDNLEDPFDQDRKFEIHIGNYNEDSDGCILVGLAISLRCQMLTSSKQAFKKLMEIGVTEIEVEGAP